MPDLDPIFNLFKLTHSFASIERTTKLSNRQGWETDPEHSYQLALLGWYLNDALKLNLDRQKIF